MSKRLEALRRQRDELVERRNAAHARLKELLDVDDDAATAEAVEETRSLTAEFVAADPRIDQLDAEIRQLEAIVNAPERSLEVVSPTVIVKGTPNVSMRMGVEFTAPSEVRSAALRAVEQEMPEVTDSQRADMSSALRRLDTIDGKLSRHVIAHSRPEYRSAFNKMMNATVYGLPAQLTDDEMRAMEHARAVTITAGSAGTAIPTPLDPTIIVTGAHDGAGNPWRQIFRTVQTMSNTWNGVSSAGITVGYGAELAEATDNSPTLTAIAMTLYRGRGFVPFSMEAEQDWSALSSEMMSLFAIAKDDNDESTFAAIAAPAANTPSGFPYLLITNFSGQIVTSTTSNAFVVGDVHKTYAALPARFRMRANWLADQTIYGEIRNFLTSGGSPLMTELTNGMPGTILGRPHYESPSIDSTYGSGENYVLFLAAPEAFIIGDRLGTTVELIPHLFGATNNYPTGERGLFMNWRTGTQIGNQSAAVALNIT